MRHRSGFASPNRYKRVCAECLISPSTPAIAFWRGSETLFCSLLDWVALAWAGPDIGAGPVLGGEVIITEDLPECPAQKGGVEWQPVAKRR